ncbi:flavin-containing monooxygenase [Thermocatellispora tengchongensis]|uniref:flavin-containing monooxygenase n=1 Tax=Thermocatellispora tengchongensis TaxID=1073253 RepID=UPI00362B4E3B
MADRFDLRRDITFGTKVTRAAYDEAAGRWEVRTATGEEASARFLVMATGCLSVSKRPEVPGLERFRGAWYHTGHWPHEGVDFTGQRVGVIGTGSSGIQAIPVIAEQAASLTVFQRTPNFSLPAHNGPLDPETQRARKANYPEYRRRARESGFGIPVEPATASALETDEEARRRAYEERWRRGSLTAILTAYTDLLVNREANETAAEFVRGKIREIVRDPEVAETLSPRDHPFGTKRPCLDSGYYATFNRDTVTLVDLRKTPLVEITADGVRTTGREYAFDSIVFATGFDAMTGALTAIDIRGRGGVSLREEWAQGPRTYLGLGVAGFPNLFTVTGPGSPSVLSNMMVSIEQHVDWIAGCLAYLRERGLTAIEPTAEAQDAWVRHVREVGDLTLYPMADSWYMGANVPGKPRVFMPYIGGVSTYRQICDDIAAKDYTGFTLSA